jgi:hypothetical protein
LERCKCTLPFPLQQELLCKDYGPNPASTWYLVLTPWCTRLASLKITRALFAYVVVLPCGIVMPSAVIAISFALCLNHPLLYRKNAEPPVWTEWTTASCSTSRTDVHSNASCPSFSRWKISPYWCGSWYRRRRTDSWSWYLFSSHFPLSC